MQQKTADLHKLPLLIAMSDDYPIVYDILWTLSFNDSIQQQLHSQSEFIAKLSHHADHSDDKQMQKVASGILWNLLIHHDPHPTDSIKKKEKFDIMISYSHKDKLLCRQLYDELVKKGFHVWIDFDQMHGNVMDAMAQAIEQSQMIIICMSEDYRRSNFCRAEAHYAFQRQLKLVPVLLQKHYKPDGWLLFLIGQLLYVDFIKHEFPKAMEMLLKELHTSEEKHQTVHSIRPVLAVEEVKRMKEWTKEEVQEWLVKHGLCQMSRLLSDCDGRSMIYLYRYVRQNGDKQETIGLVNEDVKRRLNERLSIIELFQFQSLIDHDRQRRIQRSVQDEENKHSVL